MPMLVEYAKLEAEQKVGMSQDSLLFFSDRLILMTRG